MSYTDECEKLASAIDKLTSREFRNSEADAQEVVDSIYNAMVFASGTQPEKETNETVYNGNESPSV